MTNFLTTFELTLFFQNSPPRAIRFIYRGRFTFLNKTGAACKRRVALIEQLRSGDSLKIIGKNITGDSYRSRKFARRRQQECTKLGT